MKLHEKHFPQPGRGITIDLAIVLKPLTCGRSGIPTFTVLAIAIAGLTISLASPAQAENLIANSNFVPTNGVMSPAQVNVAPVGENPGWASGTELGPWTVNGLAALFGPAAGTSGTNADVSPGAPYQFNNSSNFNLYGPGAAGGGQNNGLTLGPNGGNFVALDGSQGPTDHSGVACPGGGTCSYPIQASISQTITGLQIGVPAVVSFNWAAGQQSGFPGDTTMQLQVSLCPTSETCPNTDLTPVVDSPQGGFQNWMPEEFTFTPTSATEVLTFLAIGTPAADPPIGLLDGGVSLSQIPEPSTWSLLGISFAVIAGIVCRRRKSVPAKTGEA